MSDNVIDAETVRLLGICDWIIAMYGDDHDIGDVALELKRRLSASTVEAATEEELDNIFGPNKATPPEPARVITEEELAHFLCWGQVEVSAPKRDFEELAKAILQRFGSRIAGAENHTVCDESLQPPGDATP